MNIPANRRIMLEIPYCEKNICRKLAPIFFDSYTKYWYCDVTDKEIFKQYVLDNNERYLHVCMCFEDKFTGKCILCNNTV